MKLKNFRKLKLGDKVVVKSDIINVFSPGQEVRFIRFNYLSVKLGQFTNGIVTSALRNTEVEEIKKGSLLEILRDTVSKQKRKMKNSNVILIQERDIKSGEMDVVGIATSIERAEAMIDEYYGDYKVQEYRDIRDSGIIYCKKIITMDMGEEYSDIVEVWLHEYVLDGF